MSPKALSLMATPYGSRYVIGTPEDRGDGITASVKGLTLASYDSIIDLENEGLRSLKSLFQAKHVETRLMSGVHATIASILSLTNPRDRVLSLAPEDGGHFATKPLVEKMGRQSTYLAFDSEFHRVDIGKSRQDIASASLLILDMGVPLAPLNVSEIKESQQDGAVLLYDASHTLGLIAGSEFQKPLQEGADILQGNTHKSFPGPVRAICCTNSDHLYEALSDGLTGALVSHPSTASMLALYQTALELECHAASYAQKMIQNRITLHECLFELGIQSFVGQIANLNTHILFLPMPHAVDAVKRLASIGIIANNKSVWGMEGVRIGVQEVTRLGMGEQEMEYLSKLIYQGLTGENGQEKTSSEIRRLSDRFSEPNFWR